MSRSANLYALQQTDSEIDTRTARLAEINSLLGETEELVSARQRLQRAGEALSQWRTQQRNQDLVLQDLERKRKSSELKLYSGKIRNPKELSDLQEEISSLNRRKGVIEDKLLEIMLSVEEGEAEESEADETLKQLEEEWKAEQVDLLAENEALENELADLSARRQFQVRAIPPADLRSYEHLRPRKRNLAVAILRGAECQGCMTSVSAARAKEARSDALAYCGTCGRILFAKG